MVSHKVFGIFKIPKEYVGMVWATVLIRISLMAFEMNFSFYPITLLVVCFCRSLNVLTLDFPPTIDSPRYCHTIYFLNIYSIFLFLDNV